MMPISRSRSYLVQPGDTLLLIAQRFGVSVDEVKRANGLTSNMIYVSQQLVIPSEYDGDYVVQPGDTLYAIAARHGLTVQELKQMNRLQSDMIYIGQHLRVAPDQRQVTTYTVKAGDSLYGIAQQFNTTVDSMMKLNQLTTTALNVGQTLTIPAYSEAVVTSNVANIRRGPGKENDVIVQMVSGARLPVVGVSGDWYKVQLYNESTGWISKTVSDLRVYDGSKPITHIYGYYTLQEGAQLPSSYESFVQNTENLSSIGLFLFRINLENPTEIEKFGEFTDEEVRTLVNIAHRNNIKILAVVHNLLYKRGDTTPNKEVVKTVSSSPENRRAFALNLVELIERYNLDGVDIDIEDVYLEDRENLILLYQEIARTLHERGYFFSVAVPSKVGPEDPSEFAKPFDYPAIGSVVDEFVVMLYNEHGWPGSGPGPVVSIGRMERVLRYAMTVMPKEKIVAAVSVFGFDFNLATDRASYATYDMAMNLAEKYNKEIIFDEETKTPMFAYVDEQGQEHEVWFENAASIQAKMELAAELGIRGLALWRLGMEDPEIWTMLSNEAVVSK